MGASREKKTSCQQKLPFEKRAKLFLHTSTKTQATRIPSYMIICSYLARAQKFSFAAFPRCFTPRLHCGLVLLVAVTVVVAAAAGKGVVEHLGSWMTTREIISGYVA